MKHKYLIYVFKDEKRNLPSRFITNIEKIKPIKELLVTQKRKFDYKKIW